MPVVSGGGNGLPTCELSVQRRPPPALMSRGQAERLFDRQCWTIPGPVDYRQAPQLRLEALRVATRLLLASSLCEDETRPGPAQLHPISRSAAKLGRQPLSQVRLHPSCLRLAEGKARRGRLRTRIPRRLCFSCVTH